MMLNAIPPGDAGAIKVIGREQGFLGLAVHFTTTFDTGIQQECPCLQTAWTPSPDELAILNSGGNVMVQLLAHQHPPIAVYVDYAPTTSMPRATFDADMLAKCAKAVRDHRTVATKKSPLETQLEIVAVILKAAGMVEAQ